MDKYWPLFYRSDDEAMHMMEFFLLEGRWSR